MFYRQNCPKKGESLGKNDKQAGAELGQAQVKFS